MFKNICVSAWKHGRRVFEEALHLQKSKPTVKFAKRHDVTLRQRNGAFYCDSSALTRRSWISRIVGNQIQTFASNLRRKGAQQLQSGPFSLFSRSFAQRSLSPRTPLYAFVGVGLSIGFQSEEKFNTLNNEIVEDIQKTVRKSNKVGEMDTKDFAPQDSFSHEVHSYDFGTMISKGCDAAVYEAKQIKEREYCVSEQNEEMDEEYGFTLKESGNDNYEKGNHDLAIKVMFNLYHESNQSAIIRGMEKEIIPAKEIDESNLWNCWMFGKHPQRKRKILPPHPNIIKIKEVFVDEMMEFDACHVEYPDSLPSRLHSTGLGRNQTLYIVMKKYDCTLREYVWSKNLDINESLLLFSQLLEGVLHLNKAGITHRDLKSDNILIEADGNIPRLVITDFGCCVEELTIPYRTYETNKGGNYALMAPEIASATVSDMAYLNYNKADLWAAGTLAYEIFGFGNPFYRNNGNEFRFNSVSYSEDLLPDFDGSTPEYISTLVKTILIKDPQQRPDPLLAANTIQLILWAPKEWLQDLQNNSKPALPTKTEIINWLLFLLTDYIFSDNKNSVQNTLKGQFLARLDLDNVLKSVNFLWSLSKLD